MKHDVTTQPHGVACPDGHADSEAVGNHVRGHLARLVSVDLAIELRRDTREPYPYLFDLTPVDEHTLGASAETMIVVGRDISARGLGFYHQQPLPDRRAIVTLQEASGRTLALLIELAWCRFIRQGWYDSGGRFLDLLAAAQAPGD